MTALGYVAAAAMILAALIGALNDNAPRWHAERAAKQDRLRRRRAGGIGGRKRS